jgi:hypothetical protein
MANRREPAESGPGFFEAIANLVKSGIGTLHAVDSAKPAQPVTGLREREPYVPRTTFGRTAVKRSHHRECQQIAGCMVKHLRWQWFRLASRESFRLRDVQPACRLYKRIKTAARRPRAIVAISAQRGINDPWLQASDIVRADAALGERARPVTLDEDIGITRKLRKPVAAVFLA